MLCGLVQEHLKPWPSVERSTVMYAREKPAETLNGGQEKNGRIQKHTRLAVQRD